MSSFHNDVLDTVPLLSTVIFILEAVVLCAIICNLKVPLHITCHDLLVSEIISSSREIDRVIPGIVLSTMIHLCTMDHICCEILDASGDPVYFPTLSKDTTFVSGTLNFNAKTDAAHTERDLVYTLIGVSLQEGEVHLQFVFRLNQETVLKYAWQKKCSYYSLIMF